MSVRLDHGGDSLTEVHEINVTPFIDVMLVLLIIFMVAAPLATVDIAVNLPASTAEPQPRPDKPVFLTVKGDLSLAIGEQIIPRDLLGSALSAATKNDKDPRIFLRADRGVRYGDLMEVMNLMRKAGFLKVALVGLEKAAVAMMEFSYEDRRDWLRWALSGVIVLALHGGIAAAMVQWRATDDSAEPTAAMVIDLAPFPVSPAVQQMDIAPGPDQVEAQAAVETKVEQPEETNEETAETKDVTEFQPDITPAQNPEMVVAALPPKPEPQSPKPQEAQLPVPVTTAPQVMPEEVAPVAAAPAQGQLTVNNSDAIPTWRHRIVSQLERNKRYPLEAQNRHEQGTAQLAFSIDRRGRLTSSKILHSSGSRTLDNETLELVRRAQPFPPPPPELAGAEISLSVPIKFNIR